MSERAPLVSAIIPTHNAAAFIGETLESIFAQTYPNLEVIVVNDASTDETASVLKPYRGRITYIERPRRQGPAAARNTAIAASSGDIVAFIDSDDLWLPERVSKGADAFIANPQAGLVATNVFVQDERTGNRRPCWKSVKRTGDRPTKRLLIENFICTSGTMVSRRALDEVGAFDESFAGAEDYELWYRIATRFDIELIEEPLVVWRYRPASLSSDPRRMLEHVVRFYEKVLATEEHAEERGVADRRRGEVLFKLGVANSLAGDEKAARVTFEKLAKVKAPSVEASLAIKIHRLSPSLFKVLRMAFRTLKSRDDDGTMTDIELVV